MPDDTTTKDTADSDQRLAYLEQLGQTLMGLQSSNQALIARRGLAGADETRQIDIRITINDVDWAKVMAAQTLYFSENVRFKPPTPEDLASIQTMVKGLDAIIAAQVKAAAIIAATTKLVTAFKKSQP